ncbi:MAG: hypothetical protein CMA56_03475 [Euryarchaeota archaeon]|nr:hypothetical protein [Euryarchaeota archaeon]
MLEPLRDVLAWAAVFNHALTVEEIHRYITEKGSTDAVERALRDASFAVCTNERWHLRTAAYDTSHAGAQRKHAAAHLREVGPVLAQLAASPTVEAMAITGSVAAGVNDEDGDVDLLIIARPGHVWRVRALAIYLQHNVPGGYRICPNMVIDRENIGLRPSVYAARELAMMRPLKGHDVLASLVEANAWCREHQPNAVMRNGFELPAPSGGMPWWWTVMRAPLAGRWAERWEAGRRISELQSNSTSEETTYTMDRCVGHENAHRSRIEREMRRILRESFA